MAPLWGTSDFKKLLVWQKAHALALDAHRAAGQIRGRDNASTRNQMVRAAASISTNIVEGSGQRHSREFCRFLRMALNSSNEFEYHLITARDLQLMNDSSSLTLRSQVIEVRKMLYGLIRYLSSGPDDRHESPPEDAGH